MKCKSLVKQAFINCFLLCKQRCSGWEDVKQQVRKMLIILLNSGSPLMDELSDPLHGSLSYNKGVILGWLDNTQEFFGSGLKKKDITALFLGVVGFIQVFTLLSEMIKSCRGDVLSQPWANFHLDRFLDALPLSSDFRAALLQLSRRTRATEVFSSLSSLSLSLFYRRPFRLWMTMISFRRGG